jgi:putative ATP-dependent endonuclease of the OLD family
LKKLDEKGIKAAAYPAMAKELGFIEHALTGDGKVTRTSYKAGIEKYLAENNIEYDEPQLGETQALGIPPNLLSALPEFFLLPAITDYSGEIDRRSSSTVFRRLMGNLSDRLLRADPRYQEVKEALSRVRALLNPQAQGDAPARLSALSSVETELRDVVKCLMPSVQGVSLIDGFQNTPRRFAMMKMQAAVRRARMMWPSLS